MMSEKMTSEEAAEFRRKFRICALCWDEVPRDTYNEHMQQAHGYETLEVWSKEPRDGD